MRIATGKVEIGQGILTAMTQIAAEELDVRPDQIRLVSGETDVSPSEYFTSGSYSVSVGGAAIRLVCAEVRAMLTDKAAEALGCKPSELSVEEGQFLRGGKATGRDYWSMATAINLDRRASGTAPTKSPSKYKIVGTSLPRLDLPAKVKGAAFIHDIAVEGVVHARDAAPAMEGRSACFARRGGGAQGGQRARRNSPRWRVRRLHRSRRACRDARR